MELLGGCMGDAKALCKGTYNALAATKDSHITQTTCTKKKPPERSPAHPAPCHKPSCKILIPGCSPQKGKDTRYFQRSPLQVEPGALCSLSLWFTALAAASKEEEELGGRTEQAQWGGQLIRKAARDVGLPDKLWDVPPHLINANEAVGPRETSRAPHWVYTQITG